MTRFHPAIALAGLFLLAAAAPPEPRGMTREQVDTELRLFVAQARAGYLLHPLTHYQCGKPARIRKLAALNREYLAFEGEYRELGGTFLPDEEQGVLTEGTHVTCPEIRPPVLSFRSAVGIVRARLDRANALLRHKRELLHVSRAPLR